MSEPEFVFEPVHATVVTQEGNDLVEDAVTAACDFCLDARIEWDYPCEDFTLPVPGLPMDFGSQGHWAACQRCSELIEAGDLPGLIVRSMRSWKIRHGSLGDVQLDSIGRIQHGFFDHRQGERIPSRQESDITNPQLGT